MRGQLGAIIISDDVSESLATRRNHSFRRCFQKFMSFIRSVMGRLWFLLRLFVFPAPEDIYIEEEKEEQKIKKQPAGGGPKKPEKAPGAPYLSDEGLHCGLRSVTTCLNILDKCIWFLNDKLIQLIFDYPLCFFIYPLLVWRLPQSWYHLLALRGFALSS